RKRILFGGILSPGHFGNGAFSSVDSNARPHLALSPGEREKLLRPLANADNSVTFPSAAIAGSLQGESVRVKVKQTSWKQLTGITAKEFLDCTETSELLQIAFH